MIRIFLTTLKVESKRLWDPCPYFPCTHSHLIGLLYFLTCLPTLPGGGTLLQMWISGQKQSRGGEKHSLRPSLIPLFNFSQTTTVSWDDSSSRPSRPLIIAFDVLYIVGPLSLLAILLTAWRAEDIRQRRLPTWFMAVGSWVFISVANILLIGRQTGPSPPPNICLAQAMLIYAAPVL